MNYAYARVSSRDQRLERQLAAFEKCGIEFDAVFCDKKSGTDFERQSYKKLVKKLKRGDLVVIKSIDRLGRSYDNIIREWEHVTKHIGADIYVLDMPLLDTRCSEKNLIGKLISDIVLQLLSFVAENERENIHSRQAEGISSAKARGVKFGRPRITCSADFPEIAENYIQHKIGLTEALTLSNMKISSFYRYIKAYRLPVV